jgi:large subunit ribosomal protein L24
MMIKSSKPRKQRKFRHTAPLHQMQHMAHAHISKELRQRLKIAKRSIQVSKGDTVKLVSGKKKGTTGKVVNVDLRKGKLSIDSMNRKDVKGKEKPVFVSISNVYITDLNLSDKKRAQKLKVAPTTSAKPSVEAKDVIQNGKQREQ